MLQARPRYLRTLHATINADLYMLIHFSIVHTCYAGLDQGVDKRTQWC